MHLRLIDNGNYNFIESNHKRITPSSTINYLPWNLLLWIQYIEPVHEYNENYTCSSFFDIMTTFNIEPLFQDTSKDRPRQI